MKTTNLLLSVIAVFGLTTASFSQVPSYVPSNGLVGWWPFNGNTNDESGNENNGISQDVVFNTDRFEISNSAGVFNGISSRVELTNPIMFYGMYKKKYTISLWYLISDNYGYLISGRPRMLNFNNPNFVTQYIYDWGLLSNTDCTNSNLEPSDSSCILHEAPEVAFSFLTDTISDWKNLVVVKNEDQINYYIIGNLITTNILDTNQNWGSSYSYYGLFNDLASNEDLFINCFGAQERNVLTSGTYNLIYENVFNGKIDDIGIWNRVLTQQEITNLYNGCQLTVSTQPNSQTININNNAQFTVGSSDPSATYQWQTDLGVGFQNLNSVGQYSGSTTNSLTVSNVTMSNNNQPFRCIVSSGSCSDTTNIAVLTVNNNVGINESSQNNLFTVFPNPARSVINLKADSKLLGQIYSICDNTRRVVLSGKLNSENTTIELSNLSGGIYMFSVGENMKQTFKVIKE